MGEENKRVPGGLVVFFEGIDGVGKTTQLQLAAEALRGEGLTVHTTRAHGSTPLGEELRKVSFLPIERAPNTNLYISMAIHSELMQQLAAWRDEESVVLVDRGPLSMAAYQIYGDGCDPELGWKEVATDMQRFGAELTIFYTATVDVAIERAARRGDSKDYFESKPRTYFERVNEGFIESGRRFGALPIDAERPIDAIQADTLSAIHEVLSAKNLDA